MRPLKQSSLDALEEGMRSFFELSEFKGIVPFALEDIDLSGDVSASQSRLDLAHYPYLVEPLECCAIEPGVRREVVVAMPEQMGKTTLELVAILYNLVYSSLQAIIVYPSSDLAVETSTVKFLPLVKKIPQFEEELKKPFALRGDRLKLSNAVVYWQGAGVKVVSKSAKLVLGDECAVWQPPPNVNNLAELKKRTRSYSECLQLFVSTPSYKQNPFWQEFLDGSQGYYHLRCRGCGELTMRSCDVHNLQFESVFDEDSKLYLPVAGSSRMVCPVCRHEHAEEDREWMVVNGAYVHKFEDRRNDRPSYQCGVLASLLPVHSWDGIAEAQLRSGRSAELADYVSFDNSIRGLPYQEREYNAQTDTALSKLKYAELPKDDIEATYLAVDTQDTFSVVGRFALMRTGEIYLVDISRPRYMWLEDDERGVVDAENKRNGKPPEKTVMDMLDEPVLGVSPLLLLVDHHGHRTDEVKAFSRRRKNILMYGGTSLRYDTFKPSETVPKLFLFNEKTFRADLVFKLYHDKQHTLRLPETLSESDLAEITCVQPDTTKRNGNLFENWQPKSEAVHDAFDVLKMGLCAVKLSVALFRRESFRFGEARVLQGLKHRAPRPKMKSTGGWR